MAFVHRHLLPVIIVIEPRQQIAGFQGHAFIHGQIDDAAGYLEAHQAFVRFNVSRKLEHIFIDGLAEPLGMEVDHCAANRQKQQERNHAFHGSLTSSSKVLLTHTTVYLSAD